MTIDQLTDEYQKWCEDNQLPLLSADELLADLVQVAHDHSRSNMGLDTLSRRILWLNSFIARWDAADEEETYCDL